MSERLKIYQHKDEIATSQTQAKKVLDKTKTRYSKIKGRFVLIHGFLLRTEIFIRAGVNVEKKIEKFKAKVQESRFMY
jgi:hypothetical protein